MEEGRRRAMLGHQMSVVKRAPNYHGRDDDDEDSDENEEERHGARTTCSARSYGFIEKESSTATSRTLFDIIQDEESSAAFAYKGVFDRSGGSNKLNWKSFKDRLRIRRTGSAWNSSGDSVPISDDFRGRSLRVSELSSPRPLARPKLPMRSLVRIESRISRPRIEEEEEDNKENDEEINNNDDNDDDDNNGDGEGNEGESKGAGTVSLMSLLGEMEGPYGAVTNEDYEEDEEQEEEEEEDREGGEDGGEQEYVCCVCMVRHKGSAFIPCGHTFCRLCSREMWVSRGNCPLCNGYIYEILNVFS